MNKRQHVTAGVVIGPIVNYGLKWILSSEWSVGFFQSIILGIIGAILPDILEPPKSIWHRKFFHSRMILIMTLLIIMVVFALPWLNGAIKTGLLIVSFSYLSHLIMDSRSPAGLPRWDNSQKKFRYTPRRLE